MYSTISRYIEAVSEPSGFFKTLTFECKRDTYGYPELIAGGNAAVFKIVMGGKHYALKCHTKSIPSLRTVYEAIRQFDSSLLYESRYLPDEIYTGDSRNGAWCDAAITEWAEGHTLEFAIRRALRGDRNACNNGTDIASLADNFDSLAIELLDAPWAHGDLKPENIMVAPSGRMRLIDYDAMFVPQLQGCNAAETGTPLYQHPERNSTHFDRRIDDYPIALISATLHTLSLDAGLHTEFGNSDCFLFTPDDIVAGRSKGYRAALDVAERHEDRLLYGLLRLLTSQGPYLDGLAETLTIGL